MTPLRLPSSSSSDLTITSSGDSPSPPMLRRHERRASSFSPLPTVRETEIEGKRKRPPARDTKVIYDVAMKAKPESFVKISTENFVDHCIAIPVIPFKTWYKDTKAAFRSAARKTDFSQQALRKVVEDTFHCCLNHSSILSRIQMASTLLAYRFLSDFNMSDPLRFWKKYGNLETKSPKNCDILFRIMGKQEATVILTFATQKEGEVLKTHFREELESMASFGKRKQALFNCSIHFPNANDPLLLPIATVPPFAQSYKEIAESFRSFLAPGSSSHHCIRFNGKSLQMPNYEGLGIPHDDREEHFVEWLISELQEKMHLETAANPKRQVELLAMAPILGYKQEMELRSHIGKCLKKEFKNFNFKDFSSESFKLNSFFDRLQKKASDFANELRSFSPFLANFLFHHSEFQTKDWDNLSVTLFLWHKRLFKLKEKRQRIPSLPYLQSMTMGSFGLCAAFLNKIGKTHDLKPIPNDYHLILNRESIGSYDIHFQNNNFDVSHIKWFDVVSDKIVKGKIKVSWSVSIKAGSQDPSFQFNIQDASITPQCSEEEGLIMMDQLLAAMKNIEQSGFKTAQVI